MLLMTAMASGPQTTEFNGFFRDLFRFGGCSGSRSASCTGSYSRGYGSCSGSRSASCTGSCSGRTSAGLGSCSGSYARSPSSCCGSSAYASCCGGMVPSYQIPYTTPYYACPSPTAYYSTPADTSGCFGSGGGYQEPSTTAPLAPLAAPRPATPPATEIEASISRASFVQATPDRGTVVVRLPADALLYAEGRKLSLTGPEREFVTPRLTPGEYGYTFKVEYARNGETLSRSRQVVVRPGETVAVDFAEAQTVGTAAPPAPPVPAPASFGSGSTKTTPADQPTLASATRPAPKPLPPTKATDKPIVTEAKPTPGVSKPARIVVKLPPGATLTVDGQKQDRPETVRQFQTPPIPPGELFTYTLKVDWPAGGAVKTQAEKVTVRAGSERTVDFTNWLRVGG